MGDYRSINKAMWDERAPAHAASADYGFDRFISDSEHLSGVVRFDRPRLGDLTGQRGVRLQCHIGTDTLSIPGHMVVDDTGEWRLNAQPERLAASYTLQATCDVGTVEFTTRLSRAVGDVRRA
ncbi:MAG: hypothetical protein ACRDUW_19805 [Pseudonocardiaceae bacterium]